MAKMSSPQLQSTNVVTPLCTLPTSPHLIHSTHADMATNTAQAHQANSLLKTKIIVMSDTHGMTLSENIPSQPADVCIHCGDLTDESKLDEFRATLDLLRAIKAPLKLIIAGNHDFTLDTMSFTKKIQEARPVLEPQLVKGIYGDFEEARRLLLDAEKDDIHFLDEGTHRFDLRNGAKLVLYASPFTPSLGDWGFQYRPNDGHRFDIGDGTDIVVTHGPPRGVLDRTSSRERAGCPDLFKAVALKKPLMHCFGHIHEGWGAKMVTWRERLTEKPSYFTDIDNEKSFVVEQRSAMQIHPFDADEDRKRKQEKINKYSAQNVCNMNDSYDGNVAAAPEPGKQTLFVNASIKGDDDMPVQPPWLLELELPAAVTAKNQPLDSGEIIRKLETKRKWRFGSDQTDSDPQTESRRRISTSED